MKAHILLPFALIGLLLGCAGTKNSRTITSGNPLFEGWYADPEGVVFNDEYWIYPTYSSGYEKQVFFDAFSSKDLIKWKKHEKILDTATIKWANQAMWAPAAIQNGNRYFLFFSANDIQRPGGPMWDAQNSANHTGGIGIAVADSPSGPFSDYLGKPLISDFHNDAQPIDQFVFKDTDGTHYIFYGGWGHCNLGKLNDDFTAVEPWDDGSLFKEITPPGYVEGPFMFLRDNIYYLMWSEGGWTNDTYKVAYAMADKATGPFERIGTILEADKEVATGAGHNSVVNVPNTDQWYMVYHRRPIPNLDRDHRVTCMDLMEFNSDGTIKPIKMTFTGVPKTIIKAKGD
ncbi:MAG: glycoside hydrolase family 43 protein [Sediminicola sp.]|tara:strand:- start:38158 stop:39189 length:1032 start_codon:yes stop_codon:yes gene_type:complete